MLKSSTVRSVTLLAAASISGCSGGGGSSPPPTFTPPPVISYSHTFSVGSARAAQGTAWDITGVTTTLSGQNPGGNGQSYDTLRVDVTFAQDISTALPAPGSSLISGNQLGVSIGLNTDGKRTTGYYSFCAASQQDKPYEYVTDNVKRIIDGNYSIDGAFNTPIVSGPPNPQAEAQTVVSGNILSQTIVLGNVQVFSGAAIPHIGIAVLATNGIVGGTDPHLST